MSDPRGMTDEPATDYPPPLPPPPRPVTPVARRRSWAELPVRPWMILSAIVLLVTAYFTITRVSEARTDRWLIANGVPVRATFTNVNGDPVSKRRPRNEAMSAIATFDLDGRNYVLDIPRLEAKPGAFAQVGQPFEIRVDPRNPLRWTEQTEPRPWVQELVAVGLLAPLSLLLLLVTVWKRSTMLRTWRTAPLAAATVVEVRHTSAAPRSRVVRVTLSDGDDRRVFPVLMPTSAGVPGKGEPLWLLCPPRRPARAVVAKLYESKPAG